MYLRRTQNPSGSLRVLFRPSDGVSSIQEFSEASMMRRIMKTAFLNCIQRRHIKPLGARNLAVRRARRAPPVGRFCRAAVPRPSGWRRSRRRSKRDELGLAEQFPHRGVSSTWNIVMFGWNCTGREWHGHGPTTGSLSIGKSSNPKRV